MNPTSFLWDHSILGKLPLGKAHPKTKVHQEMESVALASAGNLRS